MSWFSDLAGKAESFLNQMDQVAASSLQEAGIGTPNEKQSVPPTDKNQSSTGLSYEPVAQPLFTPISQQSSQSRFTKSFKRESFSDVKPSTTADPSSHPRSHTGGMSTSLDNDTLMSFLNSPSTKSKTGDKPMKVTPTRPRSATGQRKNTSKEKIKPTDSNNTTGAGWDATDNNDKSTTGSTIATDKPLLSSSQGDISRLGEESVLEHEESMGQSWLDEIPVIDFDNTESVEEVPVKQSGDTPPILADNGYDTNTNPLSSGTSCVDQSHSHTSDVPGINNPIALEIDSNTDPHSHSDDNQSRSVIRTLEPFSNLHNPHSNVSIPTSEHESLSPDAGQLSPVVLQPGLVLTQHSAKPPPLQDKEMYSPSKDTVSNSTIDNVKLSDLELENQMLRQEVGSLSEELSAVQTRVIEKQRVESQYRDEVRTLREQCSRLEGHLRHMRSQEDDLTSALEARDSQIHVLRATLEKSDGTVSSMKTQLEQGEREKERLICDVGLSSSAQNQALESVKGQLLQVQALLTSEKELTASLRNELTDREAQHVNEKQQLSEALHNQQSEINQFQFQYSETQKSQQKAQSEIQRLKREFEEYKIKATTVLQNKEKLIATLQSPNGDCQNSVTESILEEARAGKQQILTELHLSREQLTSLREELQNTEDQHVIDMEHVSQQLKLSEESLEYEKRMHSGTKEDLRRTNEELNRLKDEHVHEKGMLSAQLREKENELLVLSTRIAAMGTSSQLDSSRRDLEGRLQELTESLIQKQTTLEMLSSEKNSLYLQLEKTKGALKDAESVMNMRQTALQIEDSKQGAAQLRPMASILPSSNDEQGTRRLHKMKNTLDQVDRLGLHIGWVLKRYPWIRLLLVFYVLLLHLWVTFVLLTYKPEIHSEKSPGDL